MPNPIHGEDSIPRDISGVNALVFDPAWTFGAYGPRLPAEFGLRMVGGRRGERISELPPDEWRALQSWLDAQKLSVTHTEEKDRSCETPKRSLPKRTSYRPFAGSHVNHMIRRTPDQLSPSGPNSHTPFGDDVASFSSPFDRRMFAAQRISYCHV